MQPRLWRGVQLAVAEELAARAEVEVPSDTKAVAAAAAWPVGELAAGNWHRRRGHNGRVEAAGVLAVAA